MTAEELLLKKECPFIKEDRQIIVSRMIEFAKLHVELALKKAYNNSEMRVSENDTNENPSFTDNPDDGYVTITISKDSILNSYPLTNIK